MDPINLFEYEQAAKEKLPQMIFDFYAGAAHDELTLHDNRAAYERIKIAPRPLVDVRVRDLSTTFLGHKLSFPVIVPPVAMQKMVGPDGEAATARAADAAQTIMILSTLSNTTIEEVIKASKHPVFFQLYIYKDREMTKSLVQRAEAAGAKALVLTVDAPLWGHRERDQRNHFQMPPGLYLKNITKEGMEDLPKGAKESGLEAYTNMFFDPGITWKDLEWLRSITKIPVLIKGVTRADAAVRAIDHGVSGIIVSNHGGRQLDTCVATIDALPSIIDAVAGRVDVAVDGNVRRGTDVIKALALGAKAVLIGRPIIWGLAVAGQQGVTNVLEILRKEFDLAMALTGCRNVREVTRDLIAHPPRYAHLC